MKKVILFALLLTSLASCTENQKAQVFGGTMTVNIPKGQKLLNATWKKDNSLWYLYTTQEVGYVPKTTIFQEKSNFGAVEGKVVFYEQ